MNIQTEKKAPSLHEKKEDAINNGGLNKTTVNNNELTEKLLPESRKPFIKMPKKGKKEDTY